MYWKKHVLLLACVQPLHIITYLTTPHRLASSTSSNGYWISLFSYSLTLCSRDSHFFKFLLVRYPPTGVFSLHLNQSSRGETNQVKMLLLSLSAYKSSRAPRQLHCCSERRRDQTYICAIRHQSPQEQKCDFKAPQYLCVIVRNYYRGLKMTSLCFSVSKRRRPPSAAHGLLLILFSAQGNYYSHFQDNIVEWSWLVD